MNRGRTSRPQRELVPNHTTLSSCCPPVNRKRAPSLPPGLWKWLPTILVSPAKDIIRNNGLDAYMTVGLLPKPLLEGQLISTNIRFDSS